MSNKYWRNLHNEDKLCLDDGAKGKGRVIETKNTYVNSINFSEEYTDKGDKCGEKS